MKRPRDNQQEFEKKKSRPIPSLDSAGSEGYWPSFVCIPIKDSLPFNALRRSCMEHFHRTFTIPEKVLSSLCEIQDIHISLSKEFSLRFHQIHGFVERLDYYLPSILHRFKVDISGRYSILFNENKSKCFICILLQDDTNNGPSPILNLIHNVDKALLEFQRPVYYSNPIIHISIASFEPSAEFLSINNKVILLVHDLHLSTLQSPPTTGKDNSALDLLGQLYDSDETNEESKDDTQSNTKKENKSIPINEIIIEGKAPAGTQSLGVDAINTVVCSSIQLTVGFQRCYEWHFNTTSAATVGLQHSSCKNQRFVVNSITK